MNEVKLNTLNTKRAGYPFTEFDEFPITYSPVRAGIYNIYLYGTIESPQQFVGAVEVLSAATENDVVVINLQTNGGSIDATDTLLQAMHQCDGRVIVKASGGVHSAGTIILLNADEFVLSENSNFLIHNGGCGSGGKYSDFKAESAYTLKHMEKVLRNTYTGFLTDAEMEDLLKGVDLWLDPAQFLDRYNKRNEYFKAKEEAAMKPVRKPRVKKATAVEVQAIV
jgi:ATP-dependent protease ClpP protease subunit